MIAAVMNVSAHRPPGSTPAEEQYLSRLSRDLARLLIKAQRDLTYDTLCLSDEDFGRLAAVLVEFAEDIHYDIGLWRSLEQYYLTFFDTPLPLFWPAHRPVDPARLTEARLRHLIWMTYAQLNPDLILSPGHRDLQLLAGRAAEFLISRFVHAPAVSSLKQFLAQPNRLSWDVKRKLLWLGQHSYLFRGHLHNYINDNGGQATISVVDNFICQQPTQWAGLGVIDILAAALELKPGQRDDLQSWYEPHTAFYRIKAVNRSGLKAINLITRQTYTVRQEKAGDLFARGDLILGGLTPWAGEWYWSGEQQIYNELPPETIPQVIQEFVQLNPQTVYRYDIPALKRAQASLRHYYDWFKNYHQGADWVVYPDGLAMAADMQREYRLHNEALPPDILQEEMNKYGFDSPAPRMPFPPRLIDSNNGVGVFFDQGEGKEIMGEFNDLISGLKKRGRNLNEDEEFVIRSFIESPRMSPAFVQLLVQEYGDESIAAAYLLRNPERPTFLTYLLRRYKGRYYRRYYPYLTLT